MINSPSNTLEYVASDNKLVRFDNQIIKFKNIHNCMRFHSNINNNEHWIVRCKCVAPPWDDCDSYHIVVKKFHGADGEIESERFMDKLVKDSS